MIHPPNVMIMSPVSFIRMMGVKYKPDRRKRVTRKRFKRAMAEAMRRHNDT